MNLVLNWNKITFLFHRFYILHRLLQFVLCSGAAAILWSLLKLLVRF